MQTWRRTVRTFLCPAQPDVRAATCRRLMCTQSTKDMLERMVNSSDFHGLCPAGTPKTTPLVQELSGALAEPSLSPGCSRQHDRQAAANLSCPTFSKRSKRDSLHSINPAFRLASPSPSFSRSTLVLGDPPDAGFISLH
uniref:Zinc finger, DHHC-type containing 18a n=1 Tax=Iconisemion striatum TaxID=60296 RepID=A0A1A7XR68_9TELE